MCSNVLGLRLVFLLEENHNIAEIFFLFTWGPRGVSRRKEMLIV